MHMKLCPQPPWSVQTETRQKKNINTHKVATQSHLPTSDLENDQTHVTLRETPNRNVTPLSSHTTLDGAEASPNKL
jgi:hypothetical protein